MSRKEPIHKRIFGTERGSGTAFMIISKEYCRCHLIPHLRRHPRTQTPIPSYIRLSPAEIAAKMAALLRYIRDRGEQAPSEFEAQLTQQIISARTTGGLPPDPSPERPGAILERQRLRWVQPPNPAKSQNPASDDAPVGRPPLALTANGYNTKQPASLGNRAGRIH